MARVLKWFLLASFLMMVVMGGFVVWALVQGPRVASHSVLLLRFDGDVRERVEPTFWNLLKDDKAVSLKHVVDSLRRAADDPRIVGVLLDIRNPVISLADIQAIEAAMATFRASEKWNAAFLETAGEGDRGDAAYALAVTADEVVLAPSGDINLVGLRAEVPFIRGTLDRLKIRAYVEKRSEYKNAANTFTETQMTAPHREALKSVIDDLQRDEIAHLAARRNVSLEVVQGWLADGPLGAADAAERKLVDRLAYWDELLVEAQKEAGRDEPFLELSAYAKNGGRFEHGPKLALVLGDGEIHRGESAGQSEGDMGSDTLTDAFRQARDEGVKGVLFRVNSPGGSYIASDLIRREVQVTREAGIPVVVSMGSYAASGGYFVAMGANKIVAQPATITGSIGVFQAAFITREALNHWLGITFDTYEAAPNAGFFSWLDPPTDDRKERLKRSIDRIYQDFVTKAAEARGVTPEALDKMAHGRIWSGRQAKELGLVDELGDTEVALDILKGLAGLPAKGNVTLKVYPEPESPFAELSRLMSESAHLRETLKTVNRLTSGVADQALRTPAFEVRP